MMNINEAKLIAKNYLHFLQKDLEGITLVIVDNEIIERDFGWVFFYNSKEFLETGNLSFALVGNAPLIVDKNSGKIIETGTAYPIEYYLNNYKTE